MNDVTVVVPTYNGGKLWEESARLISEQIPKVARVKVIDSSSSDNTRDIALRFGFEVEIIDQKDFDHGGTRSNALGDINTAVVIFLTQDSLLVTRDALAKLVDSMSKDKDVVCAYGRQLPHKDATPLAEYARMNSYKEQSYITSIDDSYPKGFRKAFLSNSFSAYSVEFLKRIGGFPKHLILGEDSFIAAKSLLANKKVAYAAEATVRHSHNYTTTEEFRRYFDIGVFHSSQLWMLESLGSVEGEGLKFALGQFIFALRTGRVKWPVKCIADTFMKYIGYKLGRNHKKFNVKICRKLSMYKSYWNRF